MLVRARIGGGGAWGARSAATAEPDPLYPHPFPSCPLLRMMRQAGRYQKAYRDLAAKHPSFRQR
jgi:hypothetical protein